MNLVQERVQAIIADMQGTPKEYNPTAADQYRKLAIIDYSDYLKRSVERSPEVNQTLLENVFLFAEKAISLGASRERIDGAFAGLRDYWLPRLKEVNP
jgi:arsenate reductase-like glutaredoxin family protein